MKKTVLVSVSFALLASLLSACGGPSVERIKSDEVRDLSGAWNDTDSRLVSEEMMKDVLSRAWIPRFETKNKRPPAVIVGTIRNRSHEHINTQTFTNDIARELINSGRVEFVASSSERTEIREERVDQDLNATTESRKAMGKELGADYMLKGDINTIIDTNGKSQIRYYQVDLTLISLKDNRKVWIGQKKIKKAVANARVRY